MISKTQIAGECEFYVEEEVRQTVMRKQVDNYIICKTQVAEECEFYVKEEITQTAMRKQVDN